jgi:hypothetical protein
MKSSKIDTTVTVTSEIHQLVVEDISFDAVSGKIVYTLPENAYVRIRIGLTQGGPLLTHLLDWEYRPKGRHVEEWNGKVGQSPVDYRTRKDLMLTIFAYSAPLDKKNIEKYPFLQPVPAFDILFPEAKGESGGYPVLEGNTSIRVMVQPDTMTWLSDLRYEIALYFDDLFMYEEEEGVSPYTYFIDTTKYNDGLHRINVNILCSSGQAGAVTKVFMIKNERPGAHPEERSDEGSQK